MASGSCKCLRCKTMSHDRFWSHVLQTPECWLWLGPISKGYGLLKIGSLRDGSRRNIRAHVLSWERRNGKVPEGMFVLHKCDVRHCVRPSHLFLGTADDNSKDMMTKGRQCYGSEQWDALLDPMRVVIIRGLHAAGVPANGLYKWFSVSYATVTKLLRGQSWSHV